MTGETADRLVDDPVARWTEHDLGVPGRVLSVVRAPDPVLSRPGGEVDPTAADVVQLAADLVATMRVSPGCVGLAAPQVGVSGRMFCVDVTAHPKTRTHHGTFVLCNAVVVFDDTGELLPDGRVIAPHRPGRVTA